MLLLERLLVRREGVVVVGGGWLVLGFDGLTNVNCGLPDDFAIGIGR